MDTMPFK